VPSLGHYPSPSRHDERRDRLSTSGTDHEDAGDTPPPAWRSNNDESAFVGFLGRLSTLEFELPMYAIYPPISLLSCLISASGVLETPEVVRHCLTLFFTHINLQQYCPLSLFSDSARCEFLSGPAFLQDLQNGSVQPCLINAMCALSAR
jgi:hypothetical protein